MTQVHFTFESEEIQAIITKAVRMIPQKHL